LTEEDGEWRASTSDAGEVKARQDVKGTDRKSVIINDVTGSGFCLRRGRIEVNCGRRVGMRGGRFCSVVDYI
jgi:hypothetical protein